MASIKDASISGVKWMTVSTAVSSIVAILRLSILARFLDKADFGIVAILSFVLGLTSMFSDMGFSTVILHKQDIDRKQFSSLFWIQMVIYLLLYLIVICFTHPIAVFYEQPILHVLLPLSLVDILFLGVGKLYETVLQKNFQFKTIAVRNIVSCLLSLLLAVIMAVVGFGVYTLVISTLFATVFLALWNFIVGQRHIKLMFYCTIKENIPLIKIGLYQTGTQIIDYFCTKLDVIIIGKFLGMDVLGLYNLSKEFIFKFIQLINSIVSRVLSPAFAKIQTDLEKMRTTYCYVMKMLTSVTFPCLMIVAVLSTPIISILYGADYLNAAPLTSILAIAAVGTAIGNPVRNIIVATGRTDLTFNYVWIRAFVTIPCVYICAQHSIQMVAWGQLILAIIDCWLQWRMEIKPSIFLPLGRFIKSFANQGELVFIIGLSSYVILKYIPFHLSSPILQIIIFGTCLFVIYLATYYLSLPQQFADILQIIKRILKK